MNSHAQTHRPKRPRDCMSVLAVLPHDAVYSDVAFPRRILGFTLAAENKKKTHTQRLIHMMKQQKAAATAAAAEEEEEGKRTSERQKNSKTCKYKWPTSSDAPTPVSIVGRTARTH